MKSTRSLFLLIICICSHTVFAQDEIPSQAPEQLGFRLGGDETGNAVSSVNLFTGEVAFPINLVSLPGRHGLGPALNIGYNSGGVTQVAQTWNKEAPTGVLGLGWKLDMPRIIADHRQTGTREDDEYYLVEGGSSNRLIYLSGSYKQYFTTEEYTNWTISYQPSSETWEIIKEDGTVYSYGTEDQAIQWIVRWGNWIGNSSRTSGQTQLAVAWHLSSITNRLGDEIYFAYQQKRQLVGDNTGKQQTEAIYLRQISGPNGDRILLYYADKLSDEYYEPHTEKAEPDGYQEQYERQYLDHIKVLTKYSLELKNIQFEYDFIGSGDLGKRILTGIAYSTDNGEVLPGFQFDYARTGSSLGKMTNIVTSSGSSIDYTYSATAIHPEYSNRELSISAPSGYAEPEIYWGTDYALVTWRQLSNGAHWDGFRNVRAYMYTWDGYWKEQNMGTYYNVEMRDGFRRRFQVKTGKDMVAVANWTGSGTDYNINLYHRDKLTGEWRKHAYRKNVSSGDPILLMGDRYVALHSFSGGDIFTFIWNGSGWTEKMIAQNGNEFESTGANNWIMSHQKGGTDYLRLHHLNEDNEWETSPVSSPFNSDHDRRSYWYASPSFAIAMASGNPEFIYSWNANLNSFTRHNVVGEMNDLSKVMVSQNSTIGIVHSYVGGSTTKALRYDGSIFRPHHSSSVYAERFSLGNDFLLYEPGSFNVKLSTYDANNNTWSADEAFSYSLQHKFTYGSSTLEAGIDRFSMYNRYYFKDELGNWQLRDYMNTPSGTRIVAASVTMDINHMAYNYADDERNWLGFAVQFFRNGEIHGDDIRIPGEYFYTRNTLKTFPYSETTLASLGIIITAPSHTSIQDVTSLKLYKIANEQFQGQGTFYPVTRVTVNTGMTREYTSFSYDAPSATVDANATTALYNKVRVVPGSTTASSTPFGYTDTYFFNGLHSWESALAFPARSADPNLYRNVLKGAVYATIGYDKNGTEVSRSETSYQGFHKNIYDSSGKPKNMTYDLRPVNNWSKVDGLEVEQTYNYNEAGQLSNKTNYNYNSKGQKDTITEYYKYWWEAYDPNRTGTFLGPVVQRKIKVNTTVTSSSATIWKEHNGKDGLEANMPYTSYIWKGTGSPDFSTWNGTPSTTEWQVGSGEVLEYNENFDAVLTRDLDGNLTTTVYDHGSLPVATAYNAGPDKVLVLDFDDHDVKNSSAEWQLSLGWKFENGVLTHPDPDRPGLLYTPVSLEGTGDYIAEFDFKFVGGSGYLGYQFSQNLDIPGYDIRITNDAISLYYQGNLIIQKSFANDREWHHLTFRHGIKARVFLDGEELFEALLNYSIGNHLTIASPSSNTQIDNFRLYPENAFVSSTSYDRNYKRPVSETNPEGLTKKALFNSLGSEVASIGIDGTPVATIAGYSSFRDKGVFDDADPDVVHKAVVKGKDGFHEDFSTENPNWTYREFDNGTSTEFTFSKGELMVTSLGGATNSSADIYYLDKGQELTGEVGVEFDLRTIAPGTSNTFGLALGGDAWDTRNGGTENAVWLGLYGSNRLRAYNNATGWQDVKADLKSMTTYRIKVLIDLETQTADYFVDGKLYLNDYPLRYNTTGIQKVAFYHYGYGSPCTYAVDNLVVYADPIQTNIYLDAAGRTIQQQSKESESTVLVAEYLYDDLGRNDVQTKPTRVSGDFGFREGFVTSFNRTNGYMYGDVTGLNADGYYPYSAARYEASPLSRVLEQSRPGATYRLGSGKNGSIEYATNAVYDMGPEFPAGKYRVVKTVSPEGGEQYEMSDLAGNTIKEMSGPVTGSSMELTYTASIVNQDQSTTFIAQYTHEITYDYDDFNGPATALIIGTTPGGQEIVYSQGDIQGSFMAIKGQRYWFTVTYDPPDVYYDFDCVTEIPYNPEYCFNADNCRIRCLEPIVYYDFDCVTQIAYNSDYCFDANNCRIVCPCTDPEGNPCLCEETREPCNCYDVYGQSAPCPTPVAEEQPHIKYSYVHITYANGEEWVAGQEIYPTTQYEYNNYGDLIKVYPPNYFNPPADGDYRDNYIKSMSYDFFGRLKEITESDQGITRYIYNEKTGRVRFMQDAVGAAKGTVNYLNYDSYGRPAESGFFSSTWDEATLQAKANSSNPVSGIKRISSLYQTGLNDNTFTRGKLITASVNNDDASDIEVDEYLTYNRYGVHSRGIKATDYGGATTTISFEADNIGNLTQETVPGLGTITYSYDRLGRLSAIGEAGNEDQYARYEYNANGQLAAEVLNDNTFSRSFSYDSPGNLTLIDDPYFSESLTYTSGGYGGDAYYSGLIASTAYNYKGVTSFSGEPTSYTFNYRYDKLGKLTVANSSGSNAWDIGVGEPTSYDPNGNILKLKRGGSVKNYAYIRGTNAINSTDGTNRPFAYDPNGNITKNTDKGINSIIYDRYFNKPVEVAHAGGISRFQYGADGERVMKTTIPADGDTHYTLYVRGGNDYPVIEKERIDAGDWHTRYFIYGLTGLVATETITALAQADLATSVATFEAENMESEAVDFGDAYMKAPVVNAKLFNATEGKTASHSLRLTGETGQKVGISKMLQVYTGDTIRMKVSAKYLRPEQQKNFVPAALAGELLSSMGLPAGPEGNPLYQVFDNALAIGVAGLSAEESGVPKAFINYIYFDRDFNLVNFGYQQISEAAYEDGSDRLHEELELEFVADREGFAVVYLSNENKEYSEVYFDDFTVEQAAAPQVKFYSKDHLGSTRVVVNASGTVDARYDYDPLGEITRQTEGFISNQYRYTGQEYDAELKLHNYRARLYDSELGRFYATDPSGQFDSPYLYGFNNPVNAVDPDGRWAFTIPIVLKGVTITAGAWTAGGLVVTGAVALTTTAIAISSSAGVAGTGTAASGGCCPDFVKTPEGTLNYSYSYTTEGPYTPAPLKGIGFSPLPTAPPAVPSSFINPINLSLGTVSAPPAAGGLAANLAWNGGTLAAAGSIALVTSAADGPLPFGEIVGGVIVGGAAVYNLYENKELLAKKAKEIERIAAKAGGPPGFQYSLRATVPGLYPNVRGGFTWLETGEVWKYGETTQGFSRYLKSYVQNIGPGVTMYPEFFGNQVEIKIVEKGKIYEYYFRNGTLPPGNKIFR